MLVLKPCAVFNIRVQLELVRDLVLLADFVVVANNFWAGWVETGPVGVLREGERVEDRRYVASCC
jgi:hypothetical protein